MKIDLLLLLISCGASDAQRYSAALKAPDFEGAQALCLGVRELHSRGDCLATVGGLFDRKMMEDCSVFPEGLWKNECAFQTAERLWRAQQPEDAMQGCLQTGFARECSFHLIQAASRSRVGRSPAEAAEPLVLLRQMTWTPDVESLYWRSWWRESMAKGQALDPTGCTEPACELAALDMLNEILDLRHRANPAYCDTLKKSITDGRDVSGGSWRRGDQVDAWLAHWMGRRCGRGDEL